MESGERPRRRIVPIAKAPEVSKVSDTARMLESALNTLNEQLDRLSVRSTASTFDEKDARLLQGYIKSLVELSKEERDRDASDILKAEYSKLSDQELLELARKKLSEPR